MNARAPEPVASPEELLARFRAEGRPGDLGTLFDLTAPELFRLAVHLCADAATAEDVLQATFRIGRRWYIRRVDFEAVVAERAAASRRDPDAAVRMLRGLPRGGSATKARKARKKP